jgi:hypothetical protein
MGAADPGRPCWGADAAGRHLPTIRSYSIGQEWSGKPAVLHDSILARALKKMTDAGIAGS